MRSNISILSFLIPAISILALLVNRQRALCEVARGVFALQRPGRAVAEQILKNRSVDGIALIFLWNQVEPLEGQFRWELIDRQVARVRESGKKYSLGVIPGINTPRWVYDEEAAFFEFRWDKPWGPRPCSLVRFPIPWDPVYLMKWCTFIRELGNRYARDPNFVLVKIQGVNAQTPEFLLPHDRPGATDQSRLVNCQPTDEVAEWQRLGYRPSKVKQAWKIFAETYLHSFPNQGLVVETGPWGMPPIDDSGGLILGRAADLVVPVSIISTGKDILGGRLVAQNDGLQATWHWSRLREMASPESIAFQMAWKVTDDPACRMNHFIRPCDPRQLLRASVDRGIGAGANYLEIYEADLLNPALNDVVAEAHHRLLVNSW
jgi:Beta-galactosidase